MEIRKATVGDVRDIHRLINFYGDQGLVLPRSLSELYEHLRDHFVLVDNDREEAIRGVCGLGICWEGLAEIKSLVVSEDSQGKGFGVRLVETGLEEAQSLGLKQVFVLTYIPDFFRRFGFRQVEKNILPHKVWADCLKCPKFPDCDELAMLLDL